MWDNFKQTSKQFFVTTLLLVTKSFVYVGRWLKHSQRLTDTRERVGRFSFAIFLWILSPLYKIYRRVRSVGHDIIGADHSRLMRLASHRYTLHAAMLIVAIVVGMSNLRQARAEHTMYGQNSLIFVISNNSPESNIDTPTIRDQDVTTLAESPTDNPLRLPLDASGSVLFQPYIPSTASSVATRRALETYTIEPGDTIAGIAARFRLNPSTVLGVNKLTARSVLRVGQTLTILPTDGVLHTIKHGEQLAVIARQYQVNVDAILAYNNVSAKTLAVGTTLIIPGGRPLSTAAPARPPIARPTTPSAPVSIPTTRATDGGTTLLWPSSSHRINQYFTYRHNGLDIHGVIGGPIYAAEDGVVVESRWATGYGNMVLLKHDNGLITRYGHASKLLVTAGERVKRGEIIALVGSTGRSTGPHIHFEVITNGAHINPLKYTR